MPDDVPTQEMNLMQLEAAMVASQVAPGFPRQCGDYELWREVSVGQVGIVYLARRLSTDQLVAFRIVNRPLLRDETAARTARAWLTGVSHPNIAPLLDSGPLGDNDDFIATEYLGGGPLREHAAMFRRPREAARFMALVIRALEFAHQHGVVHGDLNLNNILFRNLGGSFQILDFCLGRKLDDAWLASDNAHPAFLAPELLAGRHATSACDQFAAGAILFRLLTGVDPFDGPGSTRQVLDYRAKRQSQPPLDVETFRADSPEDLAVICRLSLQPNPGNRYPEIGLMAAALERWLESQASK